MSDSQSNRRGQRTQVALLTGLVCLVPVGCGDKKAPETVPPTQVVPQMEPPAATPPPLPPPIRQLKPTAGGQSSVRVIDPGGTDKPQTLIEASRLAKERKRRQGPQTAVAEINDENLAEYAEGGEVIVLESEPAAPPIGEQLKTLEQSSSDSPPSGDADGDIRDEEFWRTRALELRMGWRRALDDLGRLELESAALRQQFYAEEDPYIRDSQIKPAWDRVLDRMDSLRVQSSRYESELESFLEDGRRSGAPQGWLNQGWELEPTTDERRLSDDLQISEPGEPVTREPTEN